MELIDLIAGSLRTVRETLDLDAEHDPSLAAELVEIKSKLVELQRLLDESRQTLQERDELIAQLHAVLAPDDNMRIEGAAWFSQKDGKIVDGPFCTACFHRRQQIVAALEVPKKPEEPGLPAEWVQCPTCRVPFRSRLTGQLAQRKAHTPE